MTARRATFRQRLRTEASSGAARPVLRSLVEVAIAAELIALRTIDRLRFMTAPVDPDLITIVVKTFDRPRKVRRLVRSIRRCLPGMRIVVVNDGPKAFQFPGVDVVTLPFNSGVSMGRRLALEQVATPLFLTLDDDFVISRRTDLGRAVATMQGNAEIDILGGAVINLPDLTIVDYSTVRLLPGHAEPIHPGGSRIAGLPVRLKVPNFFMGRTERVAKVGWDDELKFLDHADLFSRACGRLVTVQDSKFLVFHGRNPFDRSSPERLANLKESRRLLAERWPPHDA